MLKVDRWECRCRLLLFLALLISQWEQRLTWQKEQGVTVLHFTCPHTFLWGVDPCIVAWGPVSFLMIPHGLSPFFIYSLSSHILCLVCVSTWKPCKHLCFCFCNQSHWFIPRLPKTSPSPVSAFSKWCHHQLNPLGQKHRTYPSCVPFLKEHLSLFSKVFILYWSTVY